MGLKEETRANDCLGTVYRSGIRVILPIGRCALGEESSGAKDAGWDVGNASLCRY